MVKKLLVALVSVLAQVSAWASVGTLYPSIEVRAGDGSVRSLVAGDGSVRVTTEGDVQTWILVQPFELSGARFSTLEFAFDSDPFIAFSVALAKSTSGSSTYSFAFFSPYVGGPYDQVSSQLDGTLDASDVAQMTSITHTTSVDAVNVLSATMANCSSSGPLQTCSPASGPATSIAQTPATGFFSSTFSFTLDAPSTATFIGRSDLVASNPVPAPATLPLALLGLIGLGWITRRRAARV